MRALFALALLATPAHAQAPARIDTCLAAFSSRYIAETERNLDRAFAVAAQSDVVLSFDEADALFGKRTETSDDRYANQEVSYLLARIETYGGLATLATNRRTHIAGFNRRARTAGVILIETETGVRALEFAHADRRRALAYAEASLASCPPR